YAKEAAAGFYFRSGLFNITSHTLCAPVRRYARNQPVTITTALNGHRCYVLSSSTVSHPYRF
ncbi:MULTISPECIES: hypothetical protein, partial [Citrobacter]|uniref:hypothetical protein n=1 Tax=Citrobacter TaxID=544 RepID=UPI001CD2E889